MKRAPRPFDAKTFLTDNNIPFLSEGHKHCQDGWIQTVCPFCKGNPGWHLGYRIAEDFWNCWRCGWHHPFEVIENLAIDLQEDPKRTLARYSGRPKLRSKDPYQRLHCASSLALPFGSGPLQPQHRKYLKERGFVPSEAARQWKLAGTGPIGPYKHRIIIPIHLGGVFVSFQGRDVTNKADLKYKACSIPKEVIHHKHILYGLDAVPFDTIVIVEGILDAWKLGNGAVATFGLKVTAQQIKLMMRYTRRIILFDNPSKDPQAGPEAEKLATILSQKRGCTEIIELQKWNDPGEMSTEEGTKLMVSLGVR